MIEESRGAEKSFEGWKGQKKELERTDMRTNKQLQISSYFYFYFLFFYYSFFFVAGWSADASPRVESFTASGAGTASDRLLDRRFIDVPDHKSVGTDHVKESISVVSIIIIIAVLFV